MLSKKRIDRKLQDYISHHSGRGYSASSVKKVLIDSGFDEVYVDKKLQKHKETNFMKKFGIFSFILIMGITIFQNIGSFNGSITGFAINEEYPGYVALNVDYENGKITLNNAKYVNLKGIIGSNDEDGYVVAIIDTNNQKKELFYQKMNENKDYLIFVHVENGFKKIQIIDGYQKVIFEIDRSVIS